MRVGISRMFKLTRFRIVGLVAIADLFVLAVILVSLLGSLDLHVAAAQSSSRNLNRLVSETIAGEVARIDLMLRTTMDELSFQRLQQGDKSQLHDFLVRQKQHNPVADAVRVADADGTMLAGSDEHLPVVSVADRNYFRSLKSNPDQGLAISEPLVSRINGKPIVIFARALTDGQGRFAGVVVVPVALDWFRQKFENLEVGPHGVVVMRGDASRDFDLLARYPDGGVVGQTKVSETFRAMIAANPRAGTYEARAGADNVLRVFSYQAVGDYPLVTLVGLAREDLILNWRREAIKLAILGGMFFLVTGIGGYFLLRTWAKLERRTAELERSNTDLEAFAYAASHDLQTPLRNIASYTQLLERRYRGQLGDDAEVFLDFIVGNAKRLSLMIRDLLNYSQASEAGRRVSTVDLGRVVTDVLLRLKPNLEDAGASVRVGALPRVRGEPVWLDSVLQNLLENAIRYRAPDRPLEIDISASEMEGHFWKIAVADNGIGIAPQYHDKIFGMFYRLQPEAHPDSTGIGLPLCRRLISRFGGRLWVESELGQGARFLFTLPGTEK